MLDEDMLKATVKSTKHKATIYKLRNGMDEVIAVQLENLLHSMEAIASNNKDGNTNFNIF